MGNCRERDSLASWNRNDPSTGVWEREKGERERKKERGKVIKKIMDGSLLQLQRTNSHFQFAPGAGGEGVKANSRSNPRPDPCPFLDWSRDILQAPEEFYFSAHFRPSPHPTLRQLATSLRKTYLTTSLMAADLYAEYTRHRPGQTNSILERVESRWRKRKGERGVFIDRNIVPRRFRAAMVGRKEHSELIPSNDALA